MLLQTENNMRRLQYDLSRMVSDLTTGEREAVRDCLRILDVGRMEFASIIMNEDHRDREPITKTLRGFRPHIVGIDPLRDAGAGDPNEDGAMTDMCRGIASAVREASPKSTPLVIHHGRTGAAVPGTRVTVSASAAAAGKLGGVQPPKPLPPLA